MDQCLEQLSTEWAETLLNDLRVRHPVRVSRQGDRRATHAGSDRAMDDLQGRQDSLKLPDRAINAITEGVLVLTPDLVVISANAAFLRMTAYDEVDVIGRAWPLFAGPAPGQAAVSDIVEVIGRDGQYRDETFSRRKDGSGFWSERSMSPVYGAQGKFSQIICLYTDISARKGLQQDLERRNLALQAAATLADKANLAKSAFLAGMSHDLRSPLNAIIGFAQLLGAGTPAPTPLQQRNLDRILAGGWYLLKLVNEILDLAVIESGKLALCLQALPVAQVLLECRQLLEIKAESQGIRLRFPSVDKPLCVIADPVRLQQVMVNLLSNAIKYNRPGGTVTVGVQAVDGGRLRISVTDTGQGLCPEDLAQLFLPFKRLGQAAEMTEGTGLGLVVTKQLTELMHGTIGVNSRCGVGSEFWVEFSLTQAPTATPEPLCSASSIQSRAETPGLQGPQVVLYVEDSLANVALVEQILARRNNLKLYSAPDGQHGLALARECHPDVILMDIQLPDMSGLEVLRILRQDAATRETPVIAVSANAMPAQVTKGLSAGFFRYITKPFQIDGFLATLDLALAQTVNATRPSSS
jgi:PAS domain S-box-containing protein